MSCFKVRALELHSLYAWDFDWVKKTMKFIKDNEMNTLILHRNDFIDLIVYPGKYFGCEREEYHSIFERYQEIFRKLYKYTPTRRSGPFQRRAYLKRVLEEAGREGIDIYIQNKELYFPEILLEFYPELVKNGKICPNEPFWGEFTRIKYKEFFEEFPQIKGIITAPATGESKVSISSNRCTCDLCRKTPKQTWYENMLMSMYDPIKKAGRTLVVRDFVFNAQAHGEIASVMENLPEDVIISLKNTPHDYYPTFPDNTRIGNVGNHRQWVEFDAMGQYFGWGIGPAIMIDDMRRRMKLAKEKGSEGIVLRTDWESLDGHSSFKTLNIINQYAAAALSKDTDADTTGIYCRWLQDNGFYKKGLSEEGKRQTAKWAESIFQRVWEVVRRTVYVNDCVFSDSSTIPVSLEHALWLAEEKNSLKDWDKSKEMALSTNDANMKTIIAEKEQALALVRVLSEKVKKGNEGISKEGMTYLIDSFGIFEQYVEAFRLAVQSIMLTKYFMDRRKNGQPAGDSNLLDMLEKRLKDLQDYAEKLEEFFKTTSFRPHTVYTLLDADRLKALYNDLCRNISACGGFNDSVPETF